MAALAPVALRLLPALGAAAAGGAGYEAIEQGYRRIKNKVLDRRSRSESKNRSRSESRGSGRRHRGDQRRRSSRSSSRSSASSSDDKYGHRRQERKNKARSRRSQTTSSRYDQRYWANDGEDLNPQTGALVLRRESSSDAAIPQRPNIHRTASDPRPPPYDSQPMRPPHPHPAHQTYTSRRIPNPQEPPRPKERGFSSEAEFRVYERAMKTDPEVLSRQSIHPMTPEQDKRMGRRVLLEKGWRPRPQTGDREPYLMRRDFLSPTRRQVLEENGEELFSPSDLRAQEQIRRGQSQSPGHGFYREDYDSWGVRGGPSSLQPGERYDERRSRSQQSRYMGGRPSR